jgi:ABC-2 type transport system ATP-binding protein
MTAIVECAGLRKRFGDIQAVDDVSFAIEPGETYGLLGPNGAGKTTTISILCGLLTPDAGSVTVDGSAMTPHALDAKRAIGYVPQDIAIYPELSARENLAFFGRLHGLRKDELGRRIDEVLEVTGLAERAGDRTEEFSGGMKRRLNIAIGLLHHPRLLVLDEPTVGVDPQSRNAILESVAALSGEGMAVLYTTHYMEEAERLCRRIGIIDEGQLKAEGDQRSLVAMVGQHDRIALHATGDLHAAAGACEQGNGVRSASATADGLELIVTDAGAALPLVLASVADAGAVVHGVDVTQPNLETVFLHLTGKALRD